MRIYLLASIIGFSFSLFSQKSNFRNSLVVPAFTFNSVLEEGEIYKMEISESGIYKLTYDYLKSLGVNPDNISAEKIQIFNNGSGRIKQYIDENYTDDLVEIPYFSSGLEDGKFGKDDFILFYAGGPDKWSFNTLRNYWEYDKNIYSNVNYCFIRFGIEKSKSIQKVDFKQNAYQTSDETDVYQVYEVDNINLLGSNIKTSGSGQDWYGDNISNNSERDFSDKFSQFSYLQEKGLNMRIIFAGRDANYSTLTFKPDNQKYEFGISNVNVDDVEAIFAKKIDESRYFIPSSSTLKVKIQYNGESGWLDKLEVNGRKKANFSGTQMLISDKNLKSDTSAQFVINNADANLLIWQINDPKDIKSYNYELNNSQAKFSYSNKNNPVFVIFNKSGSYPTPGKSSKIENQNLHGINDAEMLIVYHKDFKTSAEKLAEYRSQHDDMYVYACDQEKIFNEFSCGKPDPSAIRDFARMLKIRNENFDFLLLVGDGSYDQRGIINNKDNFITVYETPGSLDPINSFPTDDYFGMVSNGDGNSLAGDMDVAVGRFPVRTAEQAEYSVQKLIDYESNPEYYGDWMNNFTLVADDEDENSDDAHFYGAEKISNYIQSKYPQGNINKIYADAFTQVQNAGGQRYPEVNEEINSNFFKGMFMFIYFGHGGPKGLAQERILQHEDILSWNNKTKLPVLITATCSFTGFDDPSIVTAGEETFLKEKGGVVSLITTVRAVYAYSNDALIKSIFDVIFSNNQSKNLPIGEILRLAKNNLSSDTYNKRKFLLFGDPSMKMKFPQFGIKTLEINGNNAGISGISKDTLGALDKVYIKGEITGTSGQKVSDFNGTVYLTLFDKELTLKTKANDHNFSESNQYEFKLQKNILFKGKAQVVNGEFEISFIMPKDINYKFGNGKLSFYAIDEKLRQASGYFSNFTIGGTGDNIENDTDGPIISLFMNDTGFINGGITNSEPILLGLLEDESGINITGFSIGHDLSAVLSSDNTKIILNDFYQSDSDSYKKGSFKYPLSKLEPGRYSVEVEAWDIYNNKSTEKLDFVVIDLENEELKKVFNFPNPFSENTFFRFEHDLADSNLDIEIYIYSMRGELVKNITKTEFSPGFQISDIFWDGTNNAGNKLASGVYVYQIKVLSDEYNIKRESKFEKLIIIK